MSKTFYRIYGSMKSVCLIPFPDGDKIKEDGKGGYYYEYLDEDSDGRHYIREPIYPSKEAAWRSVLKDLDDEIAERMKLREKVEAEMLTQPDDGRVRVVKVSL